MMMMQSPNQLFYLCLVVVACCTMAPATVVDAVKFNRYAGYLPTTRITDEASIDMDQYDFNLQLSSRRTDKAMYVYREGGHSGSYALLNLLNVTADDEGFLVKDAIVKGFNPYNETISGIILADWTFDSAKPNPVQVLYHTKDAQEDMENVCHVGGLVAIQAAARDGCFLENGQINVVNEDKTFHYQYKSRLGNKNLLTVQSLSLNAGKNMKDMTEFLVYTNYYGDEDYADKWVSAAEAGTPTSFKSGFGDSDFATHKGRSARAEAMKKGAAYLNIWMEVIRQMNDAVAFCKVTNFPAAAKAIDSAVAFYAGSKTTEEHNEGILMYALAEVRAHQMKTAGHLDNKDDGDAFVNVEIFKEFKNIQMHVSKNGTMCDAAEASKNKVVTWMQVPLIQGVLHYAYLREKEPPTEAEELERMQAEGAVFAATILPWVHRCSSRSAKIIHENMQMGAKTNFKTVKKTLEEHYSTCLNIQCEHVGGVWNHDESKYKDGATPCGVSVKSANGSRIGSIVGISVGVLLAAWVFLRFRKQLSFGGKNKNKKDIQPMYSDSGNIAAVTEIA